MSNFWRSFNQGSQAALNAYNIYRQASMQQGLQDAYNTDQEVTSSYSPEQVSKLTDQAEIDGGQWDASKQAYRMPDGGLQAPTNTPTVEGGQYQSASGETVAPSKSYSLGGITQAKAFTPSQVAAARANAAAEVYGKYGDARSAAVTARAGQQMQLGNYQLEEAENLAQEAKAVRNILKIQGEIASRSISEEEGISKLIQIADKANGDDSTFTYESVGGGKYRITEHVKDRTVGSRVATLGEIANEALKYTGPNMYNQMTAREDRLAAQQQAQDNWQVTRDDRLAQNERMYGLQESNHQLQRERFESQKDYQNRMLGLQRLRTGGAGKPPSRAGIDDDGQPILVAPDGSFYKPDGSDIVNKQWFRKPAAPISFDDAVAQLDTFNPAWRGESEPVKRMLINQIMNPQAAAAAPAELNVAPPGVGSVTGSQLEDEKLNALGIQPRRTPTGRKSLMERIREQEGPIAAQEPQFGPAAGAPILPRRALMPR